MTAPYILVTDTNIWIDIENGGILPQVFLLPYRFITPDFAIDEYRQPRWDTLHLHGLVAAELKPEDVELLPRMQHANKNLSIIDLAAYLIAKTTNATLLTGDRHLRNYAASNGIVVHGVVWLLDEMVVCQILTRNEAANTLQKMIELGARLPKEECDQRLRTWLEGAG